MKPQYALLLLSLLAGAATTGGFACAATRLAEPTSSLPPLQVWATPASAFAGVQLTVTIRVGADAGATGVLVSVDGGENYLTVSAYELMPGVASTRVLHLKRVQSANPDGEVLVTATTYGPLGPGRHTVEKIIYRRH